MKMVKQGTMEGEQEILEERKPRLLVGSPECAPYSKLQVMNKWTKDREEQLKEGETHMRWAIKQYWKQLEEGRIFVHEHPEGPNRGK